MAEERVQAERRPWHGVWFWRSLVLLALGLAFVALGEVRVIAAGGGAPPAPVLPDYTLLLPNLLVLLGSLVLPGKKRKFGFVISGLQTAGRISYHAEIAGNPGCFCPGMPR